MKYVNLVIDNKSNNTDMFYTYACNEDGIQIGNRVKVPFAMSRNLRTAYVASLIDDESTIDDKIKEKIRYVDHIEEEISLNEEMIRTAMWMKNRYVCRYIDGINCFVPSGRKPKKTNQELAIKKASNSEEEVNTRGVAKALNEEQEEAFGIIRDAIDSSEHDRFLIHGVTGSGKTEVYIRAAEEALKRGRGVIILVPEIALTGQITERFLAKFGEDSVAILHSKVSLRDRYDQWVKISRGEKRIVIGARSAVFAPMSNIGLIVVDEEHEATYKSDHTPKYDAIEVALKRLNDRDNRGVLVLGSATPSVVTYNRAKAGIYKLIKLTKRYNDISLPSSEIVDMREELKDGNRLSISRRLEEEMRHQLNSGKQVLLFLNRRGYSTFVSCRECGYVAKCPTCGLSLTYHRARGEEGQIKGKMVCHYCGHEEGAPTACPECGSKYVRYFGSGTEKIEETIGELFPDRNIDRVDLDTIKTKGELNRKLKSFERGKTDILIGTQLIAKGLDFKNVGLVGVISADVSLNIPDFRSSERAFQLITQAAGRAGRGDQTGKVIIQTYSPEHYAIMMAAQHDFERFYEMEIGFRQFMVYPPYSDLFQILFTSDSAEEAKAGAWIWHDIIKNKLIELGEGHEDNLFEPQEAYMSKIRDTYRYSLVIKCPRGNRSEYTNIVSEARDEEIKKSKRKKRKYIAVVDINPYSFS
ncbi:MAG: primosomal protein N' [Bacillota bacterium]|nr:primosomal protein N' [Bacillota bacterium]